MRTAKKNYASNPMGTPGFLRINNADDSKKANPLDRSSVHPEAYPVVERILARIGKSITEVMNHPEALNGFQAIDFVDENVGMPTVRDILAELEKPAAIRARNSRPRHFRKASSHSTICVPT